MVASDKTRQFRHLEHRIADSFGIGLVGCFVTWIAWLEIKVRSDLIDTWFR